MSIERAYKFYFHGEKEKAKRMIERIIKHKPNAKACFLYARICYEEELLESALKYVDMAIEEDPNFYEAWILRGEILFKQGKYGDALESIDKAYTIRLKYDEYMDYEILLLKTKIFVAMGLINKAKKILKIIKEINPFDDEIALIESKIEGQR